MKKLILISLLLTGCEGLLDLGNVISVEIPNDAKQYFLDHNGTAITIFEISSSTNVTIPAYPARDLNGNLTGEIYYTIGNCTIYWNLSTMKSYDPFWLGEGIGAPTSWFFSYDPSEEQCPFLTDSTTKRRVGGVYTSSMSNGMATVTIGFWNE